MSDDTSPPDAFATQPPKASGRTGDPHATQLPRARQEDDQTAWLSGEGRGTPAPAAPAAPPAPAVNVPGYDVLAELGRGAMGVVYKARHVALKRLVALKMILGGGHTDAEHRQRFRAEAEVVARLRHPNIVEIHDIGEADGLPYFALAFLEGGNLALKLAGTPMPASDAAALIETLARAVAYAHGQGVVHRDLKPANVVLTAEGEPKITDFGLAKQLDTTSQTASGEVMGTPSYMAPEQAAGKVKELGPACDTYALGAMLYECVTGRPPFRAATMIETLRQVTGAEPVSPRRLNAQVPRDLETICLKCLEKDPGKRFASAQALADDLARFRSGQPVAARPIGAVGRGWRWCRHNPAVAASLVLVAVSLLTASIVSIGFGLSAEQERQSAEAARQAEAHRAQSEAAAKQEAVEERNKTLEAQQRAEEASGVAQQQEQIARTEALRAREFSDLLLGVFESADPTGMQGYTIAGTQAGSPHMPAREILDRAVKKIREQGHPEIRAAQITSIGNVYRALGLYRQAGELLEQAYALRQKKTATAPDEMADSLYYLAWVYHETGQYPKARKYYDEALTLRRKLDPDGPKVTATLFNLAWLAANTGEIAQAEALFLDVIARRQKQHGTARHRDVAVAKIALALLYIDDGKVNRAIGPGTDAIATLRQLSPQDKLTDAMGLFMTSFVYENAGQHKLAANALQKAMDLAASELTDNHPYVGIINYELARLCESQNNHAEAEKRYRQCLKVARSTVGLGHPKMVLLVSSLGRLLTRKGERQEATAIFAETLSAHRERFGPDHPLVADVLIAYANVPGLHAADERLKILTQAVAIYEVGTVKYGTRPRLLKKAFRDLSTACRQTGSPREGLKTALKRKQIFPDDPEELYEAACEVASLVEPTPKAGTDSAQLAQDCTTTALDLLTQAIARGFADPRRLLLDSRLNPLCDHPQITELRRKLALDESALQIHRGRLTDRDPFDTKLATSRSVTYKVRLQAGTRYQIDLRSADFDTYLRVADEKGREKAYDDDSGGDLNSRLVFAPAETADYRLIVTSFEPNQTGAFVLAIEELRKK
jgi:tetratricopeptide (TPR) repeat protein